MKDGRHSRSHQKYSAFLSLIGDTMARHRRHAADETEVFALAALITGYCELVQADQCASGPERDAFVARHRAAMLALASRNFDR